MRLVTIILISFLVGIAVLGLFSVIHANSSVGHVIDCAAITLLGKSCPTEANIAEVASYYLKAFNNVFQVILASALVLLSAIYTYYVISNNLLKKIVESRFSFLKLVFNENYKENKKYISFFRWLSIREHIPSLA